MRSLLIDLLRSRAGAVWLALIAVTTVSVIIGDSSRARDAVLAAVAGETVLAIALVKVRFIGMDFMQVRGSARSLKIVLHAWCVLAFIVLSAFLLAQR